MHPVHRHTGTWEDGVVASNTVVHGRTQGCGAATGGVVAADDQTLNTRKYLARIVVTMCSSRLRDGLIWGDAQRK